MGGGIGGDEDYCGTTWWIDMITTLSNLLMCINSAANFLMYMLRGAKFRRAFLRTYTIPWGRRRS